MERARPSDHFPVLDFPVLHIPVSSFLRSSILVRSERRAYVASENAPGFLAVRQRNVRVRFDRMSFVRRV
jgi:hypothetical protein